MLLMPQRRFLWMFPWEPSCGRATLNTPTQVRLVNWKVFMIQFPNRERRMLKILHEGAETTADVDGVILLSVFWQPPCREPQSN